MGRLPAQVEKMSTVAPPSPLPVELSQHSVGELVRVELAGKGKLHNPYCHKISDGNSLGPGQLHFWRAPAQKP
jgi:hypothetical protein